MSTAVETVSNFAGRHLQDSPDWYTPSPFVEAARTVLGGIKLDPASDAIANATVKADAFYSETDNGLLLPWFGGLFVNPPGKDKLVPQFWRRLVEQFLIGNVNDAVWIGYSLEQLQSLQGKAERNPLEFTMCVPSRRIPFIENEAKKAARLEKIDAANALRVAAGDKPKLRNERGDSPPHANYITYLGPAPLAFAAAFAQFGQVVIRGGAR